MVEHWLAIDPGEATGWSRWGFGDGPLGRLAFGLQPGGAMGALQMLDEQLSGIDVAVCEWFELDSRTKVPNLTAKQIEGVVLAECYRRGIEVVWSKSSQKALVPDSALKTTGLWVTGSEVDWEDGRDVNDSAKHAIAHALSLDHQPTAAFIAPSRRIQA